MRKLMLVLSVPLLSWSMNAQAHFNLDAPPPTTAATDGGKGLPPCGPDTPSNTPTAVTGGQALMVMVDEFVPHTGFYRIALSIDSRTELPLDNVVKDSMGNILPPDGKPMGTSRTADYESTPVFPVLADHLWVHQGTSAMMFQTSITLPNVTCAKCTLQVIEFMADHGYNQSEPDGTGGGYFYHHCADLKITADPNLPPFEAAGAGGGSSAGAFGGSSAGASSGGTSSGETGGGAGSSGVSDVAGSPSVASSGGAPASAGAGNAATRSSAAGSGVVAEPASRVSSSGGCALSSAGPARGSRPALALLLLGLMALGRRRRARVLG
jgi:MYXO-CTERM domain-containing protein